MKSTTLFAAASVIALLSTPVFAQTATSAMAIQASAAPVASSDVIVTARKREERLKDVPIAVTGITADTLARQQIYQVKDIAAFAPGLNINSDAVGRSFVSIRGIGATLIDTVQPGVGIFIDGIYEPNTSYLNSPLLDVQRIEVLRGPQGTLFGNNTLGGAISVITRQPTNTFHANVSAAYAGPDDFNSGSLSISGPIIKDELQFRLGASFHNQDGFEKNSIAGGHANPLHQRSLSGTLRWEPTAWATITANAGTDEVRGGITPYIDLTGPKDNSEAATLNLNSIATYNYTRANLKGDFDVAALKSKVTAVVAYDQRDGIAYGDGDFGPVDFIRANGGNNKLETTSGELRFDTTYTDKVSSLVGVYGEHSTYNTHLFTNIVPLGVTIPSSENDLIESAAVFGTVFWKVDPTLELATGLRYDHQHVSVLGRPQSYKANELEPRVTLTKHWTPDIMTYGSISRGFRGGGSNGPGSPNPIYRGDSVWTYELGAKTESQDHKLTLDGAIFYNDYDHFIGQNSLAPSTVAPGSFVAINLNTGHVTSYGAEIEAQYRPTDRWAFSTGITLQHARITDGSEYTNTTHLVLPSNRILFTPDWSFFANASYTQPVGADSVRFDGTLIGKGDRVGSTLSSASVPKLDPYYLVNTTATYIHGHIELAVFATNLFNEKYSESYLDKSLLTVAGFPAALSHNLGIQGDRRRVGVRASYKF
jgi:iron complex outermembrane receptor protein